MSPLLRAVPPGYAPLSPSALLGGLVAAAGRGKAAERRLRERLARLFPADRTFLLDSGTNALALALRRSGQARSGPVALPAYSCYDLLTAAQAADATILYYDVDPRTLQPALGSLEEALRAGASRVVVAHLFGIPVDPRPLRSLLEPRGALLIEDAAQGFGAVVDGVDAGNLADVSVLSFNRGKGMTGGAGGALLERGAACRGTEEPPRSMGRAGWKPLAVAAATWLLARPALYGAPRALPFLALGETRYRSPRPARGLPRAPAGILARAIPLAERAVGPRRARAAELAALLSGRSEARVVLPLPGCEGGFLRLPVRVRGRARAAADRGSGAGIAPAYPGILPDLPQGRDRTANPDDPFPGARELADSLYTLPTHGRAGWWGERALRSWIDRLP